MQYRASDQVVTVTRLTKARKRCRRNYWYCQ